MKSTRSLLVRLGKYLKDFSCVNKRFGSITELCFFLSEMGERCTFKDDDDCSFSFSYNEIPGKDVTISVQREKGTHYIALHYELRCVTLYCVTLRYVTFHFITLCYITLHYNPSNFSIGFFSSQGFFLLHEMHPQVFNIAVTATDFSESFFFLSFISLSQGSRSTGCHSWRCRRSTGRRSSFAPYLETAGYYPGMC